MTKTPLSKYDYGYLHGGNADWYGSAAAMYYGPPLSHWYSSWLILVLKAGLIGSALLLPGGLHG